MCNRRRFSHSSWPGLTGDPSSLDESWRPGASPGITMEKATASRCRGSAHHPHNIGPLHDQELLAIELDFGARPFAKQHAVADVDVDRDQLAGLVAAARTDCRD